MYIIKILIYNKNCIRHTVNILKYLLYVLCIFCYVLIFLLYTWSMYWYIQNVWWIYMYNFTQSYLHVFRVSLNLSVVWWPTMADCEKNCANTTYIFNTRAKAFDPGVRSTLTSVKFSLIIHGRLSALTIPRHSHRPIHFSAYQIKCSSLVARGSTRFEVVNL
jgi:hypothetical protein